MSRTTSRARPSVAPPADRRFHRAEVPIERRRRGRTLWRTLRWVGLLVVAGGTVTVAGVAVADSDVFRVRDLRVTGHARLTTAEVESLVAGLRDENILHVDLEPYARRIRSSSWVADVRLFRVLPATIAIQIRERQPMVVARHNQRLYLVDDTGIIIDEYSAAHHAFDLPIVDGLLSSTTDGALATDPERVELARLLLADFEGRSEIVRRLSQIDVSNGRDARVLFDEDPAWLHLGQDRFRERLQTYLELRPALRDRFDAVDYVDLRFDERVYVKGRPDRMAGTR